MAGEKLNQDTGPNPVASEWLLTPEEIDAILKKHKTEEIGAKSKTSDTTEGVQEASGNKKEKSFVDGELERIAKITGRPADDEEVKKLNLVLRYQEFQKYKNLYDSSKEKNTMLQRGTLEDMATAKRELEEAIYLYDPSFKASDDKITNLNKEQETKNNDQRDIYKAKQSANRAAYNRTDKQGHAGRSWVKERMARNAEYNNRRKAVSASREANAEAIAQSLNLIEDEVKNSEIYQTYELNKDDEPAQPIKSRRDGVKDYYKEANGIKNHDVNFYLYPHAPETKDADTAGTTEENVVKDSENAEKQTAPASTPEPEEVPDVTAKTEQEDKAKLEAEEKAKLEAEEKARLEAEEKARQEEHFAELEKNLNKQLAEAEEKIREEEAAIEEARIQKILEENIGSGPLTAINADFTHDRHELARDLAEQSLNEEVAKAGFIKRLWKGTLFKKFYQKELELDFLEGARTTKAGEKDLTLDELIVSRSNSAIRRFVLGATEDMQYIHEKIAAKKDKKGRTIYEDGEKLEKADEETTAAVKKAIENFASAPEGTDEKTLRTNLLNELAQIDAEAKDNGKKHDSLAVRNYIDVAIQARKCALQGVAMERVMAGFAVYNAEVRDNIRTQAHRDNIDKIVNKIEESKIGGLLPAEVLAGGLTVASTIFQWGARIAGGGILASSAISGLKERNRITEDRARMLRDLANGNEYGQSKEDINKLKGRKKANAKEMAKYEEKIGGTSYQLAKATDLITNIENAKNAFASAGDESSIGKARADLLRAIAEARIRIDYSDSEQKDLIAYSSEDERGTERLALDMMVIRAEKALSETDRTALATMEGVIAKNISEDIKKKDDKFANARALLATKKAGKTLALGGAFMFGVQEIAAVYDDSTIGVIEKIAEKHLGKGVTGNAENASETLLASIFGFNRGSFEEQIQAGHNEVVSTRTVNANDKDAIAELEGQDYTRAGRVQEGWTSAGTKETLQEIDASELGGKIKIDGFANNGTKGADFNELRLHMDNGQMVSKLTGNSTMGSQSFNYEELAAAGKIKGIININGTEIEVMPNPASSGNLSWGENGIFTTLTGEQIKGISDSGEELFKYFRVAVDNDVPGAADGVNHVISLATEVGKNSTEATITKVIEGISPVEHPAVDLFVKTTAIDPQYANRLREIYEGGFAIAPETARTGLGAVRRSENRESVPTPQTEAPQPQPETVSESTPEAEPAPAESEAEPTAQEQESTIGDLTRQAENTLRDMIENYRDIIGDEGVNFFMNTEGLSDEDSTRYINWWSTLSENTKDVVMGLAHQIDDMNSQLPDLKLAKSIRVWLNLQPGYRAGA